MNFIKRTASGLAAVALGTAMFFAAAPASQAANARERCQHQIQKAEMNLEKAVHRHGERSRQADERRHELNAQREHCWNEFHSWWNGRENRWHSDRDWDRF
jgi:type II secretory pathway component PulJ